MLAIPLIQSPNQQLSFNADGALWMIKIYQSIQFMCADITLNNVPLINGVRCFGGIPLMPYTYMYAPNFGNFIFDSDADWTNFGGTCNLYYLESDEFATFQSTKAAL